MIKKTKSISGPTTINLTPQQGDVIKDVVGKIIDIIVIITNNKNNKK